MGLPFILSTISLSCNSQNFHSNLTHKLIVHQMFQLLYAGILEKVLKYRCYMDSKPWEEQSEARRAEGISLLQAIVKGEYW